MRPALLAILAVLLCAAPAGAQDPADEQPVDARGPAIRLTHAVFDGKDLRITLRCSEACAGTLSAFFVDRRVSVARAALGAAGRRRVVIPLGPRSRRTLLRRNTIAVRARIRDRAGNETRLLAGIRFVGA